MTAAELLSELARGRLEALAENGRHRHCYRYVTGPDVHTSPHKPTVARGMERTPPAYLVNQYVWSILRGGLPQVLVMTLWDDHRPKDTLGFAVDVRGDTVTVHWTWMVPGLSVHRDGSIVLSLANPKMECILDSAAFKVVKQWQQASVHSQHTADLDELYDHRS